ncbi:MAG: cadherin repeat domain-containing protein, partial [Gammaproteobacteria bacterium]
MHFRLLSVFLLLFILAACGGGSGSGGSDSSGEFEVMIAKNQNWLAVTCNKESDIACKNNQMTLELLYREKGSDSAFESFDSGDIEWSAGTAENEYVKLEKTTKSDRFRKLIAIKACPEKNPECVVVTGTLITSKKSFTTTTPFVVKPTEDNLTPTANIDLSLITVDGIKIQGMTDDNIVLRGGTEINLSSSGSIDYDGGVSGYFWDVPDEISSTDKQSPEITIVTPESDEEKIYGIVLNVFDAGNTPGKKNFELTVKPVKPKAYVSSNTANGKSDDTIRLIGSNSTFSEGTITDYQWEQIAPQEPYIVPLIPKWDEKTEGEKIPRGDIDISLPTLSEADAEKGKDLKFRLTVINNLGYSAYKEITIGIVPEAANKAPIFSSENLGFEADSTIIKNHTANEQTDVCIIAEATDSDTGMESFEFTWSAADEGNEEGIFIKKTETILNDSDNNLKTRVCYQLPLQKHDSRNYTLTIRALDKAQQSSSQTLSLTVEPINTKPSIVINGDINNETVTITATATDSDGTIKELEWTETGSLTGDISPQNLNTKTATNSFTFTKPILKTGKSYGFTIKATDDEGEEYEKSYGYFIANTPLTPTEINITYNQESGASFLNWSNMEKANGYRIYKTSSDGIIDENTYTEKTEGETS